MMKMMDKTNIDFIGPRYYCMAGSLILIVLGLIATAVRGQGMLQHRLHRRHAGHDPARTRTTRPSRTCRSRKRAEFVREKADEVLPDVTVESLRVGDDKSLTRGSTSARPTTEPEHVKTGDPGCVRPDAWRASR